MPDPCRRQAHGPAARYLDALSFLSRLVVRPGQTEGRFQACLSGFAPAGLTLGLLWAGLLWIRARQLTLNARADALFVRSSRH